MYQQLLSCELEILAEAEQLLAHAKAARQRDFNLLREQYLQRIAEVQGLRTLVRLNDEQRAVLLEIALALLRLDGQIRRIVDPDSSRADSWLSKRQDQGRSINNSRKPVGV